MTSPAELLGQLEKALSDLAEATAVKDQVIEQERASREAAHVILEQIAAESIASGERILTSEWVKRLYWWHPMIRVTAIGEAIGVRAGEVHKFAGRSVVVPCSDCDTPLEHRPDSRAGGRPFLLCDDCRRARDAQSDAYRVRREAENRVWNERVARGDYWIDNYGDLVVDGALGYDQQCGCGGRRRFINEAAAMIHGGRQAVVCTGCGDDSGVVDLVRYVPAI